MAEENMAMDENLEAEDLPINEDIAEEPQDDSQSLEEAFADEGDQQPAQQATGQTQQEPGYVKRRINEATAHLQDKIASLEAQMSRYQEYMLDAEANELVRKGTVKDLETARELVRYRQGQPQTAPAAESQPKNEETTDPATQARIAMLRHQADRIKADGGPDVIAEFRDNPEIKQKIVSGEMDFEDVARYMKGNKKKAPSPMRSPNGASGAEKTAIENMTDAQFDRLVKKVQGGARYSMK